MHLNRILDLAVTAAKGAADIILSASDQPKVVDHKGINDLVTQTDKESEQYICQVINDEFPDHGILAEESGSTLPNADFQWFIDPLDGTTNFVHDYPSFAVSIGVHQNNKPIAGCVIELPANHVYTAIKGEGAFCDDNNISVSTIKELEKSLLVTGFGYQHGERWERNMVLFKRFTDICQGVRRLGAAAVDLCHIASGKVDGFWEFDLHPWDSAAGILIVSEAGGKISKMDGFEYSIYDKEILVSNGLLHDQMIKEMIQ